MSEAELNDRIASHVHEMERAASAVARDRARGGMTVITATWRLTYDEYDELLAYLITAPFPAISAPDGPVMLFGLPVRLVEPGPDVLPWQLVVNVTTPRLTQEAAEHRDVIGGAP